MRGLLSYAWRHRRAAGALAIALAGSAAGLSLAANLDEGRKRHLEKRLSEARRMPGRLLT